MDGKDLDALFGKYYDFQPFENEVVKVESAGPCIRVGIKDRKGVPFSWWEPRFPFSPPPPDVRWPSQNGWDFTVEVQDSYEARGIFCRNTERHVLTLRIIDPAANPQPVSVDWE